MVSIPDYQFKTDKSAKIAICVPVRDHVTAVFSYSLAMLLKKCGETGQKTTLHMVMGSEVAMQRQQLVDEALETSCTHILWIDSDMKFPSDTIAQLLSADKSIVAGNYSTRVEPFRPVAFKSSANLDSRVYGGNGLEKVYAVGSGLMLVKREVYESIPRPHYSVSWNNDYTSLVGEDIYFCDKAAKHGHDVYVDHKLSLQLAHVGSRAYTIKGDCYD
jgi:hypothetical protein